MRKKLRLKVSNKMLPKFTWLAISVFKFILKMHMQNFLVSKNKLPFTS